MRLLFVPLRALWVLVLSCLALCSYLLRRIQLGLSADRVEVQRLRGRELTHLLQRLGATYVKLGQILGSRPDLLGAGYIQALAQLQDNVAPSALSAVQRVLREDLGDAQRVLITHLDPEPIAAASVAQVHRAVLSDGREVALKVQRLQARAQIDRDLALMSIGARLLDLVPSLKLLSLPGSLQRFGDSLRGQLDFRQEADNNRRFARNFADIAHVRVPDLVPSLCSERVLAMELVHGVKASEPHRVGSDPKALAKLGAETMLKMIFVDGFVHADLHPGNVLLTDDNGLVLIDLGMVAEVPADMVRPWVQTNLALAQQDGQQAARLFYAYAPSVGTSDYAAYEGEVVKYFEGLYGKSLGEVEVTEVLGGIMDILRRHRVQVDPSFTVVNVAMLVSEGLGKQLDPDIDMIALGQPYMVQALQNAPRGREPYRQPPEGPAVIALG